MFFFSSSSPWSSVAVTPGRWDVKVVLWAVSLAASKFSWLLPWLVVCAEHAVLVHLPFSAFHPAQPPPKHQQISWPEAVAGRRGPGRVFLGVSAALGLLISIRCCKLEIGWRSLWARSVSMPVESATGQPKNRAARGYAYEPSERTDDQRTPRKQSENRPPGHSAQVVVVGCLLALRRLARRGLAGRMDTPSACVRRTHALQLGLSSSSARCPIVDILAAREMSCLMQTPPAPSCLVSAYVYKHTIIVTAASRNPPRLRM